MSDLEEQIGNACSIAKSILDSGGLYLFPIFPEAKFTIIKL